MFPHWQNSFDCNPYYSTSFLLQRQSQSLAKVSSQNLHQLATPALIPICQDVKPMTNILKVMHNVQFTMTSGATGVMYAPKPDKTPITWQHCPLRCRRLILFCKIQRFNFAIPETYYCSNLLGKLATVNLQEVLPILSWRNFIDNWYFYVLRISVVLLPGKLFFCTDELFLLFLLLLQIICRIIRREVTGRRSSSTQRFAASSMEALIPWSVIHLIRLRQRCRLKVSTWVVLE